MKILANIKMAEISFQKMERKWQNRWESEKVFEVKESKSKKKYYVLEQFPYPSGTGLHMGHAFIYTIGDIYARFKRMQGFNVMYPMGYDSLGLPAENAAIKAGTHPKKYTDNSAKYFSEQQKALGLSYDWSRMLATHHPDFYRWDQWIFLKMLEKGLAYRKKAPVNWCPKCETVLANEQVHNGKCWRHEDTDVEVKHLEQWFFKITDYAEELANFETVKKWPDLIKKLQKNWIGKSFGTEIEFKIENKNVSKVVIVQGSNSSEKEAKKGLPENERHWKPWLKQELEKRKYIVSNELYPEDWVPDYNKWKEVFEKNKIDNDSILVGHSAGTAFLLRWLAENKRKVNKVILIAPSIIKYGKYFKESDLKNFNYGASLKKYFNEITVFYSDNDDEDIIKSAEQINSKLGGELINLKGRGHFTLDDMGTKKFPELLERIVSGEIWPIFTTRPDTIYGVTFMVVSAQHPRLMELVSEEQKKDVEEFLKKLKSVSEKDLEDLEKEGVFTGSYAINPVNDEKIPVYAGNFVVADYGCGMVMAVPAHDQRDFEFAKKYKIPIKVVIQPDDLELRAEKMSRAYTNDGKMVNSGEFNRWNNRNAIEEITKFLEKKKQGKKTVNFKLRDWLISRQRYWGTPIPIIYCEKCGIVPVSEKDLPVELPEKVKFGHGNPLITNKNFVNVKCPNCGLDARRETDTMDTFVNSSWYYLRYLDNKNDEKIFEPKKADYWCPIDMYIGGKEHACMHLIYIRFYTKFLRDLGLLKINEPAEKLFVQGMLHGEDGNKMSKSLGNTIDPMDMIKKYGADALRMFLISIASPDSDFNWSNKGMQGSNKFIKKFVESFKKIKINKSSKKIESKINKGIKEITKDIEDFKYNLAIIKIRQLFDKIEEENEISRKDAKSFLKLVHPFCPHITEELWEKMGGKGFVSLAKWPVTDEKKIDENLEKQEEAIEKLSEDINNIVKIVEGKGEKVARGFVYCIPPELDFYLNGKNIVEKKTSLKIEIYAINDSHKFDPENKAKKAKMEKPAVYLE